jgi:hypothetical protein
VSMARGATCSCPILKLGERKRGIVAPFNTRCVAVAICKAVRQTLPSSKPEGIPRVLGSGQMSNYTHRAVAGVDVRWDTGSSCVRLSTVTTGY